MLKTYRAEIESKLPFVTPPAAIIGIVKSANQLQPSFIERFNVIDIQVTESTPQLITIIFTEEVPDPVPRLALSGGRQQALTEVATGGPTGTGIQPIELTQPQAVVGIVTASVFIAAVVGALGLFVLRNLEEISPVVREVATQTGSAIRFGSVAIIVLVLGFAFLQLR